MLDSRKSAILRKVVAEHIETGQPVGSAHVVRDPAIDVSPATVRADMATLEREGYLTHPHTSAGRIPTDLGYRFFVDSLERDSALDPARSEQVFEFFDRAHSELERMLRDTSRLLSQLTDYAAVVVGPAHEILTIRSASLTRLSPSAALLVVVLSNGAVEKHAISLNEHDGDDKVERVNVALREGLVGQTLSEVSFGSKTGDPAVDTILAATYAALSGREQQYDDGREVFIGGTARMAEQFEAVDTVREVLSILEESFVVVSLLSHAVRQSHSVAIGAENPVDSLAECSLVVAPYVVDDNVVGSIGVLGPTRMNYPQALAAVAVVSQRLGRQLSSG
jgi:heat-inducible transcriptional repressor